METENNIIILKAKTQDLITSIQKIMNMIIKNFEILYTIIDFSVLLTVYLLCYKKLFSAYFRFLKFRKKNCLIGSYTVYEFFLLVTVTNT